MSQKSIWLIWNVFSFPCLYLFLSVIWYNNAIKKMNYTDTFYNVLLYLIMLYILYMRMWEWQCFIIGSLYLWEQTNDFTISDEKMLNVCERIPKWMQKNGHACSLFLDISTKDWHSLCWQSWFNWNVIRKDDVVPINWRQYKRRPIKGQEFTRVIGLLMQAISIVKDRANGNIQH